MKIDEERNRKINSVKKVHEDKVLMEERLRNQKEEEVATHCLKILRVVVEAVP